MKQKNKFEFFTPLMHKTEYQFIEKYINETDIFLEWGSGNSTIYFSGLVKKLISIEHDVDYYNQINNTIKSFDIKNIDLYHIPAIDGENRKEQLVNYINFPIKKKLKFTKVLIDGRGRKYCAEILKDYIDENVIVFIHDFNTSNVEGYEDEAYFQEILSNYDIIERIYENKGIVALKKKRFDEFNFLKDVSNEELDNIEFSNQVEDNLSDNAKILFSLKSGKEHYRLLSYLSKMFDNIKIFDIGTFEGSSAIALSENKTNFIVSYDVTDLKKTDINIDNIEFKIGNVLKDNDLLKSQIIFIDVNHDGIFEKEIYFHLKKNNYSGFIIFDDINLNKEMQNFWNVICKDEIKIEVTHLGHWSGTGIIIMQ
jgi:predicted O-methyltransferase YrrM